MPRDGEDDGAVEFAAWEGVEERQVRFELVEVFGEVLLAEGGHAVVVGLVG